MPTYEYICDSCGTEFEVKQHYTDAPIKNCPSCDGQVRRKITNAVGVIYRGGGWYCKDKRLSDIPPNEI